MIDTLIPSPNANDFNDLLAEIEAGAQRQLNLVRHLSLLVSDPDDVNGAARLLEFVDDHGLIAHLHLKVIEEDGLITLGQSREIRRTIYGDSVQSSASLFGKKDSNSVLYRNVEFGTPQADDQEVKLTAVGRQLADLWRKQYPDGVAPARSVASSDEWEQYRGRYSARSDTFEAYVNAWKRVPEIREHFKGWAVFSQFANAEPKRRAESIERVELAESFMSDAGYMIGEPTARGARQWVPIPEVDEA